MKIIIASDDGQELASLEGVEKFGILGLVNTNDGGVALSPTLRSELSRALYHVQEPAKPAKAANVAEFKRR